MDNNYSVYIELDIFCLTMKIGDNKNPHLLLISRDFEVFNKSEFIYDTLSIVSDDSFFTFEMVE
jgi:hypothetical protein